MNHYLLIALFGVLASTPTHTLSTAAVPQQEQVIRGQVLDDATDRPTPSATVLLLSDGTRLTAAETDGEGMFRLVVPTPGTYSLQAGALGYETATTRELIVDAAETVTTELRLLPDALLLTPLIVTSRSSPSRSSGPVEPFGQPLIVIDGEPTSLGLPDVQDLQYEGTSMISAEDAVFRWGERGGLGAVSLRTRNGQGPSDSIRALPEPGIVRGRVHDAATGMTVADVSLHLNALQIGGITDFDGQFLLLNIPPGTHTLSLSHPTLGRGTTTIEVVSGETTDVGPVLIER